MKSRQNVIGIYNHYIIITSDITNHLTIDHP